NCKEDFMEPTKQLSPIFQWFANNGKHNLSNPISGTEQIREVALETIKRKELNPASPKKDQHFSVLFTSDVHSHLEPVKSKFSKDPLGGAARRTHYLEKFKKETSDPVLIVDIGDFLQGTLFYEKFGGKP